MYFEVWGGSWELNTVLHFKYSGNSIISLQRQTDSLLWEEHLKWLKWLQTEKRVLSLWLVLSKAGNCLCSSFCCHGEQSQQQWGCCWKPFRGSLPFSDTYEHRAGIEYISMSSTRQTAQCTYDKNCKYARNQGYFPIRDLYRSWRKAWLHHREAYCSPRATVTHQCSISRQLTEDGHTAKQSKTSAHQG